MKKFINCLTHALDLENEDIPSSELSLWYSSDPITEISVKCKKIFHRTCREIKHKDKLLEGEWMVVFFGFVALKFDYDVQRFLITILQNGKAMEHGQNVHLYFKKFKVLI